MTTLKPMTRDQIKGVMDLAKDVERALVELPYRLAKPAIGKLDELRAVVAEQLPGFEYAECPECEEAKGIDEMVDAGDERVCSDCVARWNSAA